MIGSRPPGGRAPADGGGGGGATADRVSHHRAVPCRAVPCRAEPSRAEPSRAEPSRAVQSGQSCRLTDAPRSSAVSRRPPVAILQRARGGAAEWRRGGAFLPASGTPRRARAGAGGAVTVSRADAVADFVGCRCGRLKTAPGTCRDAAEPYQHADWARAPAVRAATVAVGGGGAAPGGPPAR